MAVPPRDRIPGSRKGIPYKVRIVHAHRRRVNSLRRLFRRNWLATTNVERAMSRDAYIVDLRGGIVGVGEYFSIIEIGGKKMRVQIDTGSSTLAVPVKGCISCIRKANRYDVRESAKGESISCESDICAPNRCVSKGCSSKGAYCSSVRPAECGFSLSYADGSAASGSLIRDEVTWGGLKSNMTFGGILKDSPNFENAEVDGILGMAYKSLACNPSCIDPPFDGLVRDGLVEDVFSICMTRSGGKLMLGGFDPRLARGKVQYVELQHGGAERYYRVDLGGSIMVGNVVVNLPNFVTAIVDTGTTLIVTSSRTFRALKAYFTENFCGATELCGDDSWFQSGMCVSISEADLLSLPSLTLTVGGRLKLVLRPSDYMLSVDREGKMFRCLGIMGLDGLGGMVVLGNTVMQRYATVYDRARGRIGFAEGAENCGY